MSQDTPKLSAFEQLQTQFGREWPAIRLARSVADEQMDRLRQPQYPGSLELPLGTDLVVFGSLARREWTSGSDLDWTLLVDAQASPEHFHVVQEIRKSAIQGGYPEPGRTRMFGTIASSHELIHHIGGLEDTNRNMTRRILLLLESASVQEQTRVVREGVVRNILKRLNRLLFKDDQTLADHMVRYGVF